MSRPSTYIQTSRHEWTPFELRAVFSLICRRRHRRSLLTLATELNEALNGTNRSFDQDISVDDVRELLIHLEKTRKYACKSFFPIFSLLHLPCVHGYDPLGTTGSAPSCSALHSYPPPYHI